MKKRCIWILLLFALLFTAGCADRHPPETQPSPGTDSTGLQRNFAVFCRTFNRFGLLQAFPCVNPTDAQK